MRIKLNSNVIKRSKAALRTVMLGVFLMAACIPKGFCDPVDAVTARQVAQALLSQHIQLYGDWNGSPAPVIADAQSIRYQGDSVAYNFTVLPSGHVLVAVDDVFSPVLLYSTRSAFDPDRTDRIGSLESVMVPALHKDVSALHAFRQKRMTAALSAGDAKARRRIQDAWSHLNNSSAATGRAVAGSLAEGATASEDIVTVGPLLLTAWSQGDPDGPVFTYNLHTPAVSGAEECAHAFTGCVATAWAQVLRYWSWPIQGQGSHSYSWNGQVLSADFTTVYDWANMPDVLNAGSSEAEKEAVSVLMYHVGVAAEMQYGCTDLGSSSEAWADDVLPLYFKYKSSAKLHDRADKNATGTPYSSAEWIALVTNEIDADPPRPVIFSIFSSEGGHEVVIDGYQRATTDMVHINFGWAGYADGFLNITADFQAGGSLWSADQQYIVIGIEPDTNTDGSVAPAPPAAVSDGGGGGGCFVGVLF